MSYKPTLPIRIDPPDEQRVWQGISYWNNLAHPLDVFAFVIDRINPQVTYIDGPWGAVGPYPDTDNKWVVSHPDSYTPLAWVGEAHELGHVLFGNANHKGSGIVGRNIPKGKFFEVMQYDRKILKKLIGGT